MENQIKTVLKVSWLRYPIRLADVAPYLFSDVFAIHGCSSYIVIRFEVSALQRILFPLISVKTNSHILFSLYLENIFLAFFSSRKKRERRRHISDRKFFSCAS